MTATMTSAHNHHMELDSPYNWANSAFLALDEDDSLATAQKWAPFTTASSAPFTIPPSLITHSSLERYGQITPPDDLSPAEMQRIDREGSIPVEQLQSEVPWPMEQSIQSLADFQPAEQHEQPPLQAQPEEQTSPKRGTKRQRASPKAAPTTQTVTLLQEQDSNPQPPKRKRGRPKSQPQTIEAYTADGFPFQVSSARQTHLEKNRVAAHKCRQRKKEYINGLEGRAREFSTKNKMLKDNVAMLREEVLELKNEVLRHAGCGFWAVDEYLAQCAGDLLGMENPTLARARKQRANQTQSPTMISLSSLDKSEDLQTSAASMASPDDPDLDSPQSFEDYLMNDLDDDLEAGE
jgi:hypothetical protein